MFSPHPSLDNARGRMGYEIEQEAGRRMSAVRGLYCYSYSPHLIPLFSFCGTYTHRPCMSAESESERPRSHRLCGGYQSSSHDRQPF